MADPGLRSKFVEMQQEQAFAPRSTHTIINPYVEGLRLDRARIKQLLSCATNKNRIKSLRHALRETESRLNKR